MLSRISYLICILLMVYVHFFMTARWKEDTNGSSTLGWDVSGYYLYLPSIFIYNDLKEQKFADSLIKKYQLTPTFEQSREHVGGNRVMMYSCGMAVMYLPSFVVAHVAAKTTGYPADGFSLPYQFFIPLGSFIAALIGLWYFRKLLLIYFSDTTTAVMLVLLVFGTNYLNYAAFESSLTHNWLFTIYVLLLLNTINFYKSSRYKYAIKVGFLYGLAVLIRPSEVIAVIIPLLWGIDSISLSGLRERLQFIIARRKQVLTAIACCTLIGSLQVVYWLYVTGQPFVYSYGEQGFSWLHPHFVNYVFSYRSGWAVYTPMVFLMLIAFIPFTIKGCNRIAVLSFFLANIYIVSAWDMWWYGGRAMVQSYPVILFPLASMVEGLPSKKLLLWIFAPAAAFFIYFNIWFTWQAHSKKGLYDPDGMTREYFRAVAGRWNVSDEVKKLKTTDELFTGSPQKMRLIYLNDFESDSSIKPMQIQPIEGLRSAYIDQENEYSLVSSFRLSGTPYRWLRAMATFRNTEKEWTTWKMPQFTVQFVNNGETIKTRSIRIPDFMINGQTEDIFLDVMIPREPFDEVRVFAWNPGSTLALSFDNLRVYLFN